jgi:hypothetical protein
MNGTEHITWEEGEDAGKSLIDKEEVVMIMTVTDMDSFMQCDILFL